MTNEELLGQIRWFREDVRDKVLVFAAACSEMIARGQAGKQPYHVVDCVRCSLLGLLRELNDAEKVFDEG